MFLLTIGVLVSCLWVASAAEKSTISDEELLKWEPPAKILKLFPYYLMGFDKSGNPVFLVEFGKWDIRGFLDEATPEEEKQYDMYMAQFAVRVTSPELVTSLDPEDRNGKKIILISNMDGYALRQAASGTTISKYLQNIGRFVDELRKKNNIRKGFFVNSNFVFQSVWNLMKPVFGETIEFMELFGTKQNKWLPALLEVIDQDQLPEHLGGTADHKHVKFYGR